MKFIYLGAEPTLHATLGLLGPGQGYEHGDQQAVLGLEAAGLVLVGRETPPAGGLLLAELEAPLELAPEAPVGAVAFGAAPPEELEQDATAEDVAAETTTIPAGRRRPKKE